MALWKGRSAHVDILLLDAGNIRANLDRLIGLQAEFSPFSFNSRERVTFTGPHCLLPVEMVAGTVCGNVRLEDSMSMDNLKVHVTDQTDEKPYTQSTRKAAG